MAEQTKTFSWLTTAESWAFNSDSGKSTGGHDAAVGNPSGSLYVSTDGRNSTDAEARHLWSGTWEDLGVPSGGTVTAIRVNAGYTRVITYNVVDSASIGPIQLRDSSGVSQATLWSGRTPTAADGSWVSIGQQSDQSVPGALQASTSSIQLYLTSVVDLGNNSQAEFHWNVDELSFVITYTPAYTTVPGSFTGDAVVLKNSGTLTYTADAVLKRLDLTDTFLADAVVLQPSGELTFTADATLFRIYESSVLGDAVIFKADNLQTFDADAVVLQPSGELTITADAVLLRLIEPTFDADAVILQPSGELTITADAVLLRIIESSVNADAVIKKVDQEYTFSADAWIIVSGTVSDTFTADAVLKRLDLTDTFDADAVILQPSGELTFTADADILQPSGELTFTADATLFRVYEAGLNADAVILKNSGDLSFSADAWIITATTETGDFTADAVLKRLDLTDTFDADAVILKGSGDLTFTADADILQPSGDLTFTADATLFRVYEAGLDADAVVLKNSGEKQFTADAYITTIVTETGDFTADAVIFKADIMDTLLADAVIHRVESGSWLADAAVLRTEGDTLLADAVIHKLVSGSWLADAVILAITTDYILADAVLQRLDQAATFSADAAILRTGTGTFTADAYLIEWTAPAETGFVQTVWIARALRHESGIARIIQDKAGIARELRQEVEL